MTELSLDKSQTGASNWLRKLLHGEKHPSVRGELPTAQFLQGLKIKFDIKSIYYPGFGGDRTLEEAFSLPEITYLDTEDNDDSIPYTVGDFNTHEFPPNSFDAVFLQDLHIEAHPDEIDSVIKPLKPGGVLIYSSDYSRCSEQIRRDTIEAYRMSMNQNPFLQQTDLPFTHKYFSVFTKK